MGVVEFDSRVRNQFSIRYFLRTMGGTLEENSIEREIGRPLVANPKLRWICIVYIYIYLIALCSPRDELRILPDTLADLSNLYRNL